MGIITFVFGVLSGAFTGIIFYKKCMKGGNDL